MPLAIPGCNFPLGFLLAESPDLMRILFVVGHFKKEGILVAVDYFLN